MIEQEVFYKKQYAELKKTIHNYAANEIFVVRGNHSFKASGADAFLLDLVEKDNYTSFFEFNPNPQLTDLKKGIDLFKQGNFKYIIAIGGGSVLDMAKLISVFAHQSQDIELYVKGDAKLNDLKTPLLAIPTTAGTGAEATHFAVLYINKNKYSVAHTAILPDLVYLSPEFSGAANSYLTACTGLDAFSQAIESIWSVNANAESIKYASEAIKLTWNYLQEAVKINDDEAKLHMQKAAFLAGKAINITKTTAPHALSYAFTSYYNIPHGHAVAISLPFFLEYNHQLTEVDCTDKKGMQEVKNRIQIILDILEASIDNVEEILLRFFLSIGIKINLQELISDFDSNIITNNVNLERLSNNPRKVSTEIIEGFLSRS